MSLYLTRDPLKVEMLFNGYIPKEIFAVIANYTTVSFDRTQNIPSVEMVIASKEESIIEFHLTYTDAVSDPPTMIVNFTISDQLYTVYEFDFKTKVNQIKLMEFYNLSPETLDRIETSKTTVHVGYDMVSYFFIIFNFINLQNAVSSFKQMALLQNMQLFKFLPIEFPPSIVALWGKDIKKNLAGFTVSIKESKGEGYLPAPFHTFDLSVYFWNNCGSRLVFCYILFAIGFLLKLLVPYIAKKCPCGLFVKTNIYMHKRIWDYPLTYYLAEIPVIFLLILLGLRYPTTESHGGRWSFAFTILSGLFVIVILIQAIRVVYKLNKLKSMNKST